MSNTYSDGSLEARTIVLCSMSCVVLGRFSWLLELKSLSGLCPLLKTSGQRGGIPVWARRDLQLPSQQELRAFEDCFL